MFDGGDPVVSYRYRVGPVCMRDPVVSYRYRVGPVCMSWTGVTRL